MKAALALALLAILAGEGCVGAEAPDDSSLESRDVVTTGGAQPIQGEGVVPYDVQNALFTDNLVKARAIRFPNGASARYDANGVFDLPVGTMIFKSFGFPNADGTVHWIETRVLAHENDGWHGYAYAWDASQRSAHRAKDGATVSLAGDGHALPSTHTVPNESECSSCHGSGARMRPIGIRAVELNRGAQLADWSARGILRDAPAPSEIPHAAAWKDPKSGTTAERARAYLDANCAHCHSEGGHAAETGLFLGLQAPLASAGLCKKFHGGADGRVDIVPGNPEASMLVHRLGATDAAMMMPPLGRDLVDRDATELVATWIREMPESCNEGAR